ncbi:hypothetical protein J3B02_004586 [Coemansia erecta]|nr:hypothetical protein J3B02_004586 [Coemansia erecta]
MTVSNINVRVGIGCFVTYRHQGTTYFLLGKRQGSHGSNTWGLPGGHLEMGESWSDCAHREISEECNLILSDCQFVNATNDIFDPQIRHYITVFMKARVISNADDNRDDNDDCSSEQKMPPVATLMEPDKCKMWAWVSWHEMVRGAAIRRDACDANVAGCFAKSDKLVKDGAEPLDFSALFLPLVNLIKLYGESGPPLD